MRKFIPRPPTSHDASTTDPRAAMGFGTRAGQPLPPVGEAARRSPYIADPVPNTSRRQLDQTDASPASDKVGNLHAGGGAQYNGLPPTVLYIKRLGNLVTAALARNYLSGVVESRWRLGGVSYPPDFGFGPGYHGDAGTLWPNNPQIYLRNPGIRPTLGVPQTFRYAPMGGIQPVGPSLADINQPTLSAFV